MLKYIVRNKLSVLALVMNLMSLIFSKFSKQPHKNDFPSKDEIIGLASIDVPPTDPLE